MTSTSLELSAPWRFYRDHICTQLSKWSQMCDAEKSTMSTMKADFPSVFGQMSCKDFDSTSQSSLKEQLIQYFK